MARVIEHNWQRDPDIPQVVEGSTGPEGGTGFVLTEDSRSLAMLAEIRDSLNELVLHLRVITGEEFTECDIKE
jgi:hypothetical protein